MKKICFFSSDSRPLYKKDVFRVMALPSGYLIHFRYQFKYVDLDIVKLDSYINQKCMLFFSSGNSLENPNKLVNISLRGGVLEDIKKNDDTGLIHFYLKLNDYKEFVIGPDQVNKLPPNKFVSEIEGTDGRLKQWHEIISDIKGSFENQLMYKFNFTKNDSTEEIVPIINKTESESYYKFEDESSYSLNIAFYDTSNPNENIYQSIKFDQNGELLKINAPSIIEIGALKDNKSFNVFTNSLNSNNSFTYLNINSNVKDSNNPENELYNVEIQIQIEKNKRRALSFATFSILAAISVGFGKIITDKIDINGAFNGKLAIALVFAILLGAFSAYKLYSLFNKK
jgi:hypothetical protein